MENLRSLPPNLTFTWHQGSKSFAEIYSNPIGSGRQRVDEWREAPPPQQLGEDIMLLLFHKAIELAQKWPDRHVGFVRYDIESLPETTNNAPFKEPTMEKTISYDGYIYHSKL